MSLIEMIKGLFGSGEFKVFDNSFNKETTIHNNYPAVDKEQLKQSLLMCFADKKSYTSDEISDKINKIL